MPQAQIGVGLKRSHLDSIFESRQPVDFFEIHAENYFTPSAALHDQLDRIRRDYRLSIHGVGLSLAGAAPVDIDHLAHLKGLIDRYQPFILSEHLAWSKDHTHYYNDLLPIPYNQASLKNMIDRVNQTQDYLGRIILIENPARYLDFKESDRSEAEFLNQLCDQTGCGLLMDLTNLYISSQNLGFDPQQALQEYKLKRIDEIHFAGIEYRRENNLLIDSHGGPIAQPAIDLFDFLCSLPENSLNSPALLMEWDNHLPEWAVFKSEAARLRHIHHALILKGAKDAIPT